jgi:RecJ-like exonuclease
MPNIPGPSDKQPAEGARDTIERELRRKDSTQVRPETCDMNPGDEAAAGTPGTGEMVCAVCGGTGRRDEQTCSNCGGTGKVIKGIAGGCVPAALQTIT